MVRFLKSLLNGIFKTDKKAIMEIFYKVRKYKLLHRQHVFYHWCQNWNVYHWSSDIYDPL